MEVEHELNKFLVQWSRKDFNWGDRNCATMAVLWVSHITNRKGLEQFLPPSGATKAGVCRHMIGTLKGKNIVQVVDGLYSRKNHPETGDVVAYRSGTEGEVMEFSLGICLGGDIAVMSPTGVVFLPKSKALVVWDVFS